MIIMDQKDSKNKIKNLKPKISLRFLLYYRIYMKRKTINFL